MSGGVRSRGPCEGLLEPGQGWSQEYPYTVRFKLNKFEHELEVSKSEVQCIMGSPPPPVNRQTRLKHYLCHSRNN